MRSEKGQVLIIIVLALIGLLGFAALAIDVGNIYSSRRTAQNTADAAAYAGAAKLSQKVKGYTIRSFSCSKVMPLFSEAMDEAVARASDNNFSIDKNVVANNGVEITCDDKSSDPHIDVRVMVSQTVDTSFMQIVSDETAQNVVEAVVRIRPRQLFADGKTIVALRNACGNGTSVYAPLSSPVGQWDGGVTLDGSFSINLVGGGIHSNDCCTISGTGGLINIADGAFTCNGTIKNTKPHPPVPFPEAGPDVTHNFNSLIDLVEDRCNKMDVTTATVQTIDGVETAVYPPGRHAEKTFPDPKFKVTAIKLEKGLHCLMDKDTNFVVNNMDVSGQNVTIFMDDDTGQLSISGSGTINLTPPVANCDVAAYDTNGDGCPPAVGGLLILYAPVDNKGGGQPTQVHIGGNSSSYYEGTILAPYNKIDVGGNTDALSNIGAQLIGDTIKIHGNVKITMTWDPDMGIRLPTYMNLEK